MGEVEGKSLEGLRGDSKVGKGTSPGEFEESYMSDICSYLGCPMSPKREYTHFRNSELGRIVSF